MIRMIMRVFAAVGLFGGVHSLLASRLAKQQAVQWFGMRQRNGWYRIFYLIQSVITLAGLLAYLARLPDREIYRVHGPLAWLLRLGQAGGLVFATAAAYQVGLGRILGLRSLLAWVRGDKHVPPEPEAQGPSPLREPRHGQLPVELRIGGPFKLTRHPLNLSPVPVFWLTPTMTFKRLAFNVAATIYMVLGSLYEETRLRAAYGKTYSRYQSSRVPFYWPVKR